MTGTAYTPADTLFELLSDLRLLRDMPMSEQSQRWLDTAIFNAEKTGRSVVYEHAFEDDFECGRCTVCVAEADEGVERCGKTEDLHVSNLELVRRYQDARRYAKRVAYSIKPLTWRRTYSGVLSADAPGFVGQYWQETEAHGSSMWFNGKCVGEGTDDQQMAAAQADYEKRILGYIVETL
jgi:hypothetical protein